MKSSLPSTQNWKDALERQKRIALVWGVIIGGYIAGYFLFSLLPI